VEIDLKPYFYAQKHHDKKHFNKKASLKAIERGFLEHIPY
jgi:hypothetical protein